MPPAAQHNLHISNQTIATVTAGAAKSVIPMPKPSARPKPKTGSSLAAAIAVGQNMDKEVVGVKAAAEAVSKVYGVQTASGARVSK
jgi:hypothetical protein